MVAYSLTALMVITSYPWFDFHAAVIANVFFSLHEVLSVIASVCWFEHLYAGNSKKLTLVPVAMVAYSLSYC